jgi:hypothetical protein
MQLDAVLWILLPVFIAAGSALLSFYIMQARMEVAVSKEREVIAEERVRATEQEARRRALDEFMQDFRVEERHYFRENKSVAARQKSMILQERLYFRNIPLSSWVEHEMVVEEDMGDMQHIAKGCSIFSTKSLSEDSKAAVSRLLEQAAASNGTAQLANALQNGHGG